MVAGSPAGRKDTDQAVQDRFRFRTGLSADREAAFYDSAGTEKLGPLGRKSLYSL